MLQDVAVCPERFLYTHIINNCGSLHCSATQRQLYDIYGNYIAGLQLVFNMYILCTYWYCIYSYGIHVHTGGSSSMIYIESIKLYCSVLQCVAVCCSVLQCVAVCCSVLQCVAVCCSVLHCVAAAL